MAERVQEVSCYSATLLIEYARTRGIPDESIFEDIGQEAEGLTDSMAWTDVFTWSRLARNVSLSFSREPDQLERIAEEMALESGRGSSPYQLLFLKLSPMSELFRRLGRHVRNSINHNLAVRLEKGKAGEAEFFVSPIVPSRYTKEVCRFAVGTVLGMLKLRGFRSVYVQEVSCCLREGTNECRYHLRWDPRSGLLRRFGRYLAFQFRGQQAIINGLEDRYDELQRQYEDIRRVEAALRRSEARFRAVFENILDVYYETTQDGRIIELSPSVERFSGYRRSELYGMYLAELYVDPEERQQMLTALESHGAVADYELHLRHKNGRDLTCSITATYIHDADGNPYKIAGTIRDISERKRAELVLKQSAERMRLIVQNMPVMLAAFDRRNRVIAWNQECTNVTGYAEEEMVGKRWAMAVLYPDHDERRSILRVLQERGRNFRNLEVEVQSRDGARKTLLVSNISDEFPIPGWPSWAVAHDISERREAEEHLRDSEHKFRELADNIQEVFSLNSGDWSKVYYLSPAFRKVWGLTEDQVYQNPDTLNDLILEEDRERVQAHFAAVIAGDTPPDSACEYRITRPDGQVRWLSTRLYPVQGKDGASTRIAGLSADITERREAEQEREQMEEQLRQAQKMDAVGQLAGGIAHDFNNQLAGIMGFAELLRDELGTDSRLAGFADYILIGSRRAAELTAKLLAFARKGKYRSIPVNLHKVIAEVVSLLEHSIDKRIRIVQVLRASPPVAQGDPTQLQNTLLNLGLNARDAMPDGGELTIATDLVPLDRHFCDSQPFDMTPGQYVRVCVQDTGVGMDDDVLEHVFEPFFTTKTEGKGTGMGLPSVYGTVSNHHGAVTVDSTPGSGTTFTLYLPLAPSEDQAAPSTDERTVRGNATVMVVDDEETFRDMAQATLTSLGYHAITFADGPSALEYYRHSHADVDLIMLDMVMPDLDGRAAFEQLRAINPNAQVLLCSGYSVDGRSQSLLQEGARGFIEKPFRKAQLSRKIAEILREEG